MQFELEFRNPIDARYSALPRPLLSKPGKQVWQTVLAPNSTRTVSYRTGGAN